MHANPAAASGTAYCEHLSCSNKFTTSALDFTTAPAAALAAVKIGASPVACGLFTVAGGALSLAGRSALSLPLPLVRSLLLLLSLSLSFLSFADTPLEIEQRLTERRQRKLLFFSAPAPLVPPEPQAVAQA